MGRQGMFTPRMVSFSLKGSGRMFPELIPFLPQDIRLTSVPRTLWDGIKGLPKFRQPSHSRREGTTCGLGLGLTGGSWQEERRLSLLLKAPAPSLPPISASQTHLQLVKSEASPGLQEAPRLQTAAGCRFTPTPCPVTKSRMFPTQTN